MRFFVMTVAMMFAMGVTSANQEQVGPLGTASNQATILTTTIVGFLSLLATQGFAMWREHQRDKAKREEAERQRAWDLQDRAAARDESRQRAEAQRIETIQTAIELARVSNTNRAHMMAEITKNTALTHEVGAKAAAAYEVGNNFNQRLEELRNELLSKRGQIDHIEEVSDDTNVKVTEMKEGVQHDDARTRR